MDIFKRIKLLENTVERVFESELVDINEQFDKTLESHEPCEGIDELVGYYLVKKKMTNRRALNTSTQLSDYGLFAYSTRSEPVGSEPCGYAI